MFPFFSILTIQIRISPISKIDSFIDLCLILLIGSFLYFSHVKLATLRRDLFVTQEKEFRFNLFMLQ